MNIIDTARRCAWCSTLKHLFLKGCHENNLDNIDTEPVD